MNAKERTAPDHIKPIPEVTGIGFYNTELLPDDLFPSLILLQVGNNRSQGKGCPEKFYPDTLMKIIC